MRARNEGLRLYDHVVVTLSRWIDAFSRTWMSKTETVFIYSRWTHLADLFWADIQAKHAVPAA